MFRGDFRRCSNDGTPLVLGGPDPLVGTVLAERYRIEDVIGDGGLGRVYRARHVRMSRRYAIKVPFGDVGYDRKSRARLANEAEAASRLDHPNVIGIVDVGETAEGLFYMAMDLAEGQSLADLLGHGPLPTEEALGFLLQICSGLAHAHERGLIHRDLKPDNIVVSLTSDGQALVQIIDFGLALLADAEGSRLTTDGLVVGTPYYMAPEQATDEPLDQRTDLFALGIILYEMLAGELPFEGTPTSVARQNLAIELPTVFERSGRAVDPLLDGLIGWMTRKRQDDRPASARVIAEVARAILAGDRAAAAAMLPESLRPPPTLPTVDERATVPPAGDTAEGQGADADAGADPVERAAPVPRSSTGTTALPEDATRNPLRRYALIAVVGLGLGAAAIVAARALTGGDGGGGGGRVATLDASAAPVATAIGDVDASAAPSIASASIDAASVAPAPAADAAVVEPIVRTGEQRDGGSARLPPIAPVDAAPAVVIAPVDARPLPPIDAGVAAVATASLDAASANAVTPPAGQRTLKQLYADVTSAFNAAVARHGTARTAELRRRLDTLTPYNEAVRKPALRQQAEAELRALARDLAALDH